MISSRTFFSTISVFLFLGCIHAGANDVAIGADGYPDVWWQEVPVAQLPGWEIPPQSADRSKGEVVLSKRNELGQFSNLGSADLFSVPEYVRFTMGRWAGWATCHLGEIGRAHV